MHRRPIAVAEAQCALGRNTNWVEKQVGTAILMAVATGRRAFFQPPTQTLRDRDDIGAAARRGC